MSGHKKYLDTLSSMYQSWFSVDSCGAIPLLAVIIVSPCIYLSLVGIIDILSLQEQRNRLKKITYKVIAYITVKGFLPVCTKGSCYRENYITILEFGTTTLPKEIKTKYLYWVQKKDWQEYFDNNLTYLNKVKE